LTASVRSSVETYEAEPLKRMPLFYWL
jgi:hypothetical protein